MSDQITITIDREVAERIARLARSDSYKAHKYINSHITPDIMRACEEALANPQPETPGLREAAQNLSSSVQYVRPLSDPCGEENFGLYELDRDALRKLRNALSQTPGGAQEDAIREAHTLTNPDVRKGIEEANKKISAWKKEIEDPPPTAPGEASQEVSEGVDCSRGGDGLCECGGGRFIDRLMSHSDGNVWIRLEGENLAQIESLRGDVVSLEVHRAPLGEGEPWCATNLTPPEEGVRLTGEFVAERNPDDSKGTT